MIIRIYGWRNIYTDQWYIGQTLELLGRRARKNGEGYKKNTKFWEAIRAYGWSAFEENILRLCTSREDADYWERFYIHEKDSIDNGYNTSIGGIYIGIIRPVKQYTKNGEYVREYSSVTEASIENKLKQSNIVHCCRREIPSYGGFQWRYSEDEDIVENLKEAGQPVYQLKDGKIVGEYNSITEASKSVQIGRSSIANAVCGFSKSAGGFQWLRK